MRRREGDFFARNREIFLVHGLTCAYNFEIINGERTRTALLDDVKQRRAPKTGDANNMLLWLILLCAAPFALTGVTGARRRSGFGNRR